MSKATWPGRVVTRLRTAAARWWRGTLALVGLTVAFAAWGLASPLGGGPDDDFHLMSAWCASTSPVDCAGTDDPEVKHVPAELPGVACFAFNPEESAACQGDSLEHASGATIATDRANFDKTYPPVFYAVNGVLASDDFERSALGMRAMNLLLFVVLAAVTGAALEPRLRVSASLGWLITAVPMTIYLVPSNNPSGWTLTGLAFLVPALWGAIRSQGWRRWTLHGVAAVSAAAAIGSRADGAIFATAAALAVLFIARPAISRTSLPSLGLVGVLAASALLVALTTRQASDAADGLGAPSSASASGVALLGYNLLHLPELWAGGFGSTGLGWLDTAMPGVVVWPAAAVFISVMTMALPSVSWQQRTVLLGLASGLVVLPLAMLQASGDIVGANVQPRYLWPLVMLVGIFAVTRAQGVLVRLEASHITALCLALIAANSAALYTTMRRYITGTDGHSANLNEGAEWWWDGLGSPMLWWILGTVAFSVVTAYVGSSYRVLAKASASQAA